MSIDWNKPIQTVDEKHKAELLTELKGEDSHPMVVKVTVSEHRETILWCRRNDSRIENAPERFNFERWVNVWTNQFGEMQLSDTLYDSPLRAWERHPGAIARIRVTIAGNVGQFDE